MIHSILNIKARYKIGNSEIIPHAKPTDVGYTVKKLKLKYTDYLAREDDTNKWNVLTVDRSKKNRRVYR